MDVMIPYLNELAAPIGPGAEGAQGSITGLLIYVAVGLGFSFMCSLLEASLFSTSFSFIETQRQNGNPAAELMLKHKRNLEDPITAILTLNTIAHTVGAAGAGAQAAAVFGSQWLGLISAILTLLILVLSEILPKTLGALYWKRLMPFTAYVLQGMVLVFYPLVWSFRQLTHFLRPKEQQPTITRGELEVLAGISTSEGALAVKENTILRNLLHLSSVRAKDILTPRTVMLAFQEDLTLAQALQQHPVLQHTRIPLYDTTTDTSSTFVLRHEVYAAAAGKDRHKPLRELARPLYAVPESITLPNLLDEFLTRKQHMFLVIDEYGGTEGLVTMEDVIESLLGAEITDESDIVADMQDLARQRHQRLQASNPDLVLKADEALLSPSSSRD